MRHILLAGCFVVCLMAGLSTAQASNDTTILFPPLDCTAATPFMSWDGQPGQTVCKDGQAVMKNAIPTCAAGQDVVYDGGKFYCKSPVTVPTCGADEFLSFDGTNYVCKSTGIPACGANEVLTFDGTKFYCVKRTDQIPTCGANQFLTYNGSAFQCANAPQAANTVSSGSWCGARAAWCANATALYDNIPGYAPFANVPCAGQTITASCGIITFDETSVYGIVSINCPSGYAGMMNPLGNGGPTAGTLSCVKQ